VGLVLGAGGVVGGAWLAGALAAISDLTGWQPQRADVMLGTSAGAVIAALLGAGIGPHRLCSSAAAGAQGMLAELMLDSAYRTTRRWPWLLAPGSLGLAYRALRERALVGLLCGLLPRGPVATTAIETVIERVVPTGWAPHPACWVVACDYGTGRPAVFGRPGAPTPPLTRGVAASCAIPGFFRPVGIDGRWYVDGGLRSMSNADLLDGRQMDLVVVLNPMSSRARSRAWAPLDRMMAAVRAWSAARIDGELARLRRHGVRTLLLEPTAEDLAAMGPRTMAVGPAQRVAALARETTGAQLRRPGMRSGLAALAV
jgi:NTE family protein